MPRPLYAPLQQDKREIRILVIRSSRRKNSRIRCNLIHADLDALSAAPFHYYEAVSYTWGDMSDTKRIDLDGHTFPITRNLHGLLKRLRHKSSPGFYWVDAICINQGDILERGQQVQLMKAIYERAEQVLVWLGPASADSDVAMDMIDEITFPTGYEDTFATRAEFEKTWATKLLASLNDPKDKHKWLALASLFDRPWWRRAWIRQEVAVASAVVVLCGNDRVHDWETILQAMDNITAVEVAFEPFEVQARYEPVPAGFERTSGYHHAIVVDSFRDMIEEQGHVNDEAFLFLHGRQCEATDPRDRIFALVGLAGEEARAAIVPDYELSEEEVFRKATKYLITSRKDLNVLSHCGLTRNSGDLPTWVVDPRRDWVEIPLRFRQGQDAIYGHRSVSQPPIGFRWQGDLEVLAVRGLLISKISHVGPGYIEDDRYEFRSHLTMPTTREFLEVWLNGVLETDQVPNLTDRLDAWCRTIVADLDENGNRAIENYIKQKFPFPREQITTEEPDLELIDAVCRKTCESSSFVTSYIVRRRMFIAQNGLLGIGPRILSANDLICFVYGCNVPLILRSTTAGQYELVGEAYVHSIMDGEVLRERDLYPEIDMAIV